jgi:hypothetical protein
MLARWWQDLLLQNLAGRTWARVAGDSDDLRVFEPGDPGAHVPCSSPDHQICSEAARRVPVSGLVSQPASPGRHSDLRPAAVTLRP